MTKTKWTEQDIPDLTGKVVLITGANSGLGLESAKMIAGKGAHVVMACRNPEKAESAAQEIRALHAKASLELVALDLASLSSVRELAASFTRKNGRLDVLLNNAGIMAIPYTQTVDGFEAQFGTNHLGHFALTGLLYELLSKTPGARVVSVASQAHKMGKMRFDDLGWQHGYKKWAAYGMSKLANLLFAYELATRVARSGHGPLSVAAHPGYAATNLQYAGADLQGRKLASRVLRWANPLLGQSAAMGALPQVYAATAPDVRPGEYIGPRGLIGGYPARARSNRRSHDTSAQHKLWQESERLTGVAFAPI
jgi:NAD(P)-dependent dehydrogenase (short-subunit alcohol dehydrogenase family)